MKKGKKRWDDDLDVGGNLRRRLPRMARKYFNRGQHALGTDRPWTEIHDFRLATKRFKYTLELFRSEYGPGLDKRLEELKHVQKLLGEANDCIVTSTLLEPLADTNELRDKLGVKAESKVRKLRSWWRANLGSEIAEQRWVTYLQRFAGKPPTAAKKVAAPES
jgi:CHAD domain-containing protein